MQRCAELYRKLRNTFRFLLGNLNGFDPARDRVPEADLLPLDHYMLARTRDLTEKILALVRGLRIPSRLPGGQRVRHRRPELVLPRHAQRPHVHLRADKPCAPFRANRALADHRNSRPPRRAHPQLHRRRSVGISPRHSQPRSQRAPRALPQTRRDLLPRSRASCSKNGSRSSPSATKRFASSKKRARPRRIGKGPRSRSARSQPADRSSSRFFSATPRASRKSFNVSGGHSVVEELQPDVPTRHDGPPRHRPQMRPLLELHARSLQLRHLAKRLHPLPQRAPRNGNRTAAGGHSVTSVRAHTVHCPVRCPLFHCSLSLLEATQ